MKLQFIPQREQTHSAVFLEHYASLRNWALHLTGGVPAEAEDLLHDSFVQFVRLAPQLSHIENAGAYLNRLLRNIHLARITRRARMQYVEIDALDCDSFSLTARNIHPLHLHELQQDLRSICRWSVGRRHETRSAAYLIFRFFLGYLPSEICKISTCQRESLEKGLQSARAEIRKLRPGPAWNEFRDAGGPQEPGEPVVRESFEPWMRRTVFSETGKGCLPPAQLVETLAQNAQRHTPISRALLAHLSGCQICLALVNRELGLSEHNQQIPEVPAADSRRDSLLLKSIRRVTEEIFEHRPARVELCVDAEPQLSFTVQSPRTVLKVELDRARQIDFLEAISDQGVRLLHLPVTSPDHGGEFLQQATVGFSEGRTLSIAIVFQNPKTEIVISYIDPHHHVMPLLMPAPAPRDVVNETDPNWRQRFRAWLGPMAIVRPWSFALILLLLFLLPVTQERQVMLNAEEVLQRADAWQSSHLSPETVMHRSFDYVEDAGGAHDPQHARHLRVEVWSNLEYQRTVRKLMDATGKTLATTSNPLASEPTPDTAWEYVPDAESFRLLSSTHPISVAQSGEKIRVFTPEASLVLDRRNFHPLQQNFYLVDHEIRIAEVANEVTPLASSPLRDQGISLPAPASGSSVPLLSSAELDESELVVRERLHALQADIGDDIHITRAAHEVLVTGVIESQERRALLRRNLDGLRGVKLTLLLPSEAARNEHLQHVISGDGEPGKPPIMEDWLKSRWPGMDERNRYVEQVLLAADRCDEHVLALKTLRSRYPHTTNIRVEALERDHEKKLSEEAAMLLSLLPAAGAKESTDQPSADISTLRMKIQKVNQDLEQLLTVHSSTDSNRQPSLQQTRQQLADIARIAPMVTP